MKILPIISCLLAFNSSLAQPSIENDTQLESFFDDLIQPEVEHNSIAGATLTIVKDNKVKFQKGYGYADIAQKRKVDGKNTLFRVASISKLFVWVAIMQLYEEGKLDLNDEITKYLPNLEIPNNYPQKITIKHLMSHTAGFEEELLGLYKKEPISNPALSMILKNKLPSQIRPPGTYASYSNHGTGLAAHIVENISALDFMQYVEQHILNPLGMNQSTFRQPIPAHLASSTAKGYKKNDGVLVEQGFEYVPLYPVGGASISGGDMAKFMQMLLNHGRLGDVTIMNPATSQLMTTISHQHHPKVNPMRHGFMDFSQNGLTMYGHGGDLFYHHSILVLIPEHNMGIFFSVNSDVAFPGLPYEVFTKFIDEYFPEHLEKLVPPSVASLSPFKGTYAVNRYSYDDILKLGKLMGTIEMEVTEEGYLKIAFGDLVYKWVQQDDLVFRDVESSMNLVFERDENGKIAHAFFGEMPTAALDKLGGFDAPIFHLFVFGSSLFTFLSTLVYWLFTSLFRRKKRESNLSIAYFPKPIKIFTSITLVSVLFFYLGLGFLFGEPQELLYGVPSYAYLVFSIPLLIIVLTSTLLYHLIHIWINYEQLAIWKKGAFSCIYLCLLFSMLQWNYWNLIGFNF